MVALLLLVGLLAPQDAAEFYRAGPGVTLPRLTFDVKPQYTSDAMRRQLQGAVSLECIVDTNGMPTKIRVVKSLDAELDQQAVKALELWRFEPGMKDGRAVPVMITADMTFTLGVRNRAPAAPAAPIVVVNRTERDGTATVYEITPDRLQRLPAWTPQSASQPPLPVGDAIAKGREWVNAAKPRRAAAGYNMLSVVLTRMAGAADRWCYQVNFVPITGTDAYSSNIITAVVLLDGSVVEPRVQPRP